MSEINRNSKLRNVLRAGVLWDLIGGLIFLVLHGILQKPLTPSIYPFYSIVIGFFLLMLAYIQLITSADIKSYSSNIGVVISLRVSFVITVLLYTVFSELLPMQFFVIAIVDSILVCLLMFFSKNEWNFKASEIFIK